MAILTGTQLTFSAVGNREALLDKISNITPVDTPFMSMIDETTVDATLVEWQTQVLAAAAANAQLQGDEFTFGNGSPTVRVSNRTQISRKTVIVSGTQDAVNKAGRDREIVYQMSLMRDELKRDKEFVLCSNQAPVTGNSTTAPQLRPLCGWYATNTSRGVGGANGTTSAAATDGTQRALTEALMTPMFSAAWTSGGTPNLLLTGPKQRGIISTFAGGATKFYAVEDKKLSATIKVYEGDFGIYKAMASRFVRGAATNADREVHILDPKLWAVGHLKGRKFNTVDVATTGDSEKGVILSEYTLLSYNEAGSAIVADLT